jgi:hypothetical protein
MEKPKLPGNGRFHSNNRDRRFESILLHHTVTQFDHRLFGDGLAQSRNQASPNFSVSHYSPSIASSLACFILSSASRRDSPRVRITRSNCAR